MKTEIKKGPRPSLERGLSGTTIMHQRRNVNLCGACALLTIEPRLAEHFGRDFLEAQFQKLANDLAAFFSAVPEARKIYTVCDLHLVARQHAARLLMAGRHNRIEKGI